MPGPHKDDQLRVLTAGQNSAILSVSGSMNPAPEPGTSAILVTILAAGIVGLKKRSGRTSSSYMSKAGFAFGLACAEVGRLGVDANAILKVFLSPILSLLLSPIPALVSLNAPTGNTSITMPPTLTLALREGLPLASLDTVLCNAAGKSGVALFQP